MYLVSSCLFTGRPAPGGDVRGKGVRRRQDGSGHRATMANRGEKTGVRIPVHRGRGKVGQSSGASRLLALQFSASRESSLSGAVRDQGVRLHSH